MNSQPWFRARVAHKQLEAEGIYRFELRPDPGDSFPAFEAGAHLDLRVGDKLRQYSLCNDPTERDRYVIAIQREPTGRGGSQEACDTLEAGAKVSLRGPRNFFRLSPDTREAILLAGGIGITPLLAMAESLWRQGIPFELHFCTRSESRTPFLQRLRNAPFCDSIHFHVTPPAPLPASSLSQWIGVGRPGRHLYVCGPGGFVEAALTATRALAWSSQQVHTERFSSAGLTNPGEDRAFVVEIASTGQLVDVPAGTSAIQALRASGIDVATSCSEGFCGTCLTGVLRGVPEHRDTFLSEDERARNDSFTPCCSRAVTDLLVLDL